MGNGESVSTHYVVQQKIEQQYDKMGHGKVNALGPDAGNFGVVRRAIDQRTQHARAIKQIMKTTPEAKERILRECAIMKQVAGQHPNIVEFIEFFEESGHFDLVFEFCGNGTLDEMIRSNRISNAAIAAFSHQLLSALAFLRSRCILHRDVKPANTLLMDDRTCKLGDFGTACSLQPNEAMFMKSGTPAFFPPEMDILPAGNGYTFPADVWAVGITLYMMLFKGVHPFIDNGGVETRLLRGGDFDAGMMWVYNASCYQLLRWLLMPCPWQRSLPETASNHAWLYSFGHGTGTFREDIPAKLVPDSYGRWGENHHF